MEYIEHAGIPERCVFNQRISSGNEIIQFADDTVIINNKKKRNKN